MENTARQIESVKFVSFILTYDLINRFQDSYVVIEVKQPVTEIISLVNWNEC